MKDQRVIGILANVDAGKTTLSEGLLYTSGKINKMGRVDNRDAYLDTEALEKARGITIFSKQATFEVNEISYTLLDTPGHVDFSLEMERTLRILDYAILVISAADGVSGHTKTVWRLLSRYKVPCFIFINKMDQPTSDKKQLMTALKSQLGEGCIDFEQSYNSAFYEEIAMLDETYLESYLSKGKLEEEVLRHAVKKRLIFPCYFGSALRHEGVEFFLEGLNTLCEMPKYNSDFGARIFKITKDAQGNRLSHLKITGGSLTVKDVVKHENWEGKVNQIRIYSGNKYEAVNEAHCGDICAVTGLTDARAGEGLGFEKDFLKPFLEPVLSYQIKLPDEISAREILPKLREIEEEHPELQIIWIEPLQEIHAKLMGEVQIEILKAIIEERFSVTIEFDEGRIVYKETIKNEVEGVGHFEPLRHYSEVHLLLTPLERGSGLIFDLNCSEDILSKNWQRLVMQHLGERQHKGVLTGANITDMKITLVSGRAHNKHTEGGDFRQATFRALRQGLMEAECQLLEPYYDFELEIPTDQVGRAMTDIDKMNGSCEVKATDGATSLLTGVAPVINMRNYHKEVAAYTKGFGRLTTTFKGYDICQNDAAVIEVIDYDPELDYANPTGSVFCKQGAGYTVPWYEVKDHMHLESYLSPKPKAPLTSRSHEVKNSESGAYFMSLDEINQILNQTGFANSGKKKQWQAGKKRPRVHYESTDHVRYTTSVDNKSQNQSIKARYLLVDGYNIIFAWDGLKTLAESDNMDGAKDKLLDIMSNYQAVKGMHVIVVFDAYRVKGHLEESFMHHNIKVVYTKEAQTADQYIEKFAYENSKNYEITVATSDGLQQIIVRGAGSALLSARELAEEVYEAQEKILEQTKALKVSSSGNLENTLSEEEKEKLFKIIDKE